MSRSPLRCLPILAALLLPAAAVAQASGGPAKNGNVYGHLAHQPAKAPVKSKEQAAGVAPGHAAARQRDATLQSLDAKLLRRNGASTSSAAAVGPRH